MSQQASVGFSQRIQLAWLEKTSNLTLAGNTPEQIKAALDETLRDKLSVGSDARAGNRVKSISILMNIWATGPEKLKPLQSEGLALLSCLPREAHLPVHWGMSMATYPFFGTVAETAGRLLRLQGDLTSAQTQRRLREQFGERETVFRAAQRILRCFVDWGVLQDSPQKGMYVPAPARPIEDRQLAAWMIEAVLRASGSSYSTLSAIGQSPMLFPFVLPALNLGVLQINERLDSHRQGLDEDVITLRSGVIFPAAEIGGNGERCRGERKPSPRGKSQFPP